MREQSPKFLRMMLAHDVSVKGMEQWFITEHPVETSHLFDFTVILPFYKLLNGQNEEDKTHWKGKAHEAIQWINDRLQEYHPVEKGEEDAFVLGDKLSIGDVLVFPWIHRLSVLRHYRSFEVPETDEFARFHQWVQAVNNHPAVKATLTQSDDYFIDQYKVYASGQRTV